MKKTGIDRTPKRLGNHQAYIAPYGIFEGKDGELVIATVNDKLWAILCPIMKKEELINDPLYSSSGKRAENQEKLISIIEEWLKTYEKIDEVAALLDKNGIPSCKVNNMDDIMNDPI